MISNPKIAACGLALSAALITGCMTTSHAPTTQPATSKDLATTHAFYWLDQPDVASTENFQFQPLWDTCEQVARAYQFQLDRQDYRLGLLTTKPMVSKEILEPWRKDAGSLYGVMQNSLSTMRRTIRFEIKRTDRGTFVMIPKVLIERETILERRITSAAQYRTAFSGPAVGTRTASEAEENVPIVYWTPIARDSEMERHIAEDVHDRLR